MDYQTLVFGVVLAVIGFFLVSALLIITVAWIVEAFKARKEDKAFEAYLKSKFN